MTGRNVNTGQFELGGAITYNQSFPIFIQNEGMGQFDEYLNRKGTGSIKWDYAEKFLGGEGLIPLWVADMDFKTPEAVIDSLKLRADHGTFGYTMQPESYDLAIINWLKERHDYPVEKKWLHYIPGVIPGLCFAIHCFTTPGDKVIIQPPVYQPFYDVVKKNNRQLVENPLKEVNGIFKMNIKDLEKNIDRNTKMLILCSPHNPVGRVWNQAELEKLAEIIIRNDLVLVSDEIHYDIIFSGHRHICSASVSKELEQRTVTLISPGKTFNIQGLQSATAIIANDEMREKFSSTLAGNGIFLNNVMSIAACEAAYQHGQPWLDELLPYLESNRDYLVEYCEQYLPKIKPVKSDGTYIVWLDCREMGLSQENLNTFFIDKAKVGLKNGTDYGMQGEGFMRINIGCTRSILKEALERINKA